MDINAQATPQLVGAKAKQPCQFISGSKDIVIAMIGRNEEGEMSIERGLERLPKLLASGTEIAIETTIIEGCGHWSMWKLAVEFSGTMTLDTLIHLHCLMSL